MAFMLIHLLDLQTNSPCEASPLCFSVFKIYVTWQSNTTYFFVLDCHITYILNFKQTLFFNLDAHKSSLLSGIIVQEEVWHSQGRALQYYFYSKTNKMHQCIKFILFWNDTLRVSDGLSVHRPCLLLYVQPWTPDNGWKDRPKHVQCHSKIK